MDDNNGSSEMPDNVLPEENTLSDDPHLVDDDPPKHELSKQEIIEEIKERIKLVQQKCALEQNLTAFIKETEKNDYYHTLDFDMEANEETFKKALRNIDEQLFERECFRKDMDARIDALKIKLEQGRQEYKEINTSFIETKARIAMAAVNSLDGSRYNKEEVEALLRRELALQESLERLQLESIRKKSILESTIKEKLNRAEDFTLDLGRYEIMSTSIEKNTEGAKQLKEEIKLLMKKVDKKVNMMSHLRQKQYSLEHEKLFAEKKELVLKEKLKEVREELAKEVSVCYRMKKRNRDLHHKNILLQYPTLIEDYKEKTTENNSMEKEIEELKKYYNDAQRILQQTSG